MIITKKKIFIDPQLCYTKAAYARKIKKSQTWVDRMVEGNKLVQVKINGGSFVMEKL